MDIGVNSTLCAPALTGSDADCPDRSADQTRLPARVDLRGSGAVFARSAEFDAADATLLGRFVLIRQVGAGSFGEVWQAHDGLLDRDVAIKIARTPVADPSTAPMLDEARLA